MIAKLHGLRVTGADLHYEGSIALDPDHCEQVGLLPFEFVEIWNKTTGSRISTYVIFGERGGRGCMLNGAAARSCQVGDELIIAARADVEPSELGEMRPRVAVFDADNNLVDLHEYEFELERPGRWRINEPKRRRPRAAP
ncbi:MAG: aspartate 1-decarboxylase [Gammaproteobacteria bacterium]|nr:aspartate 1-decarboxylase [Gammaproteobacteria bacterium]